MVRSAGSTGDAFLRGILVVITTVWVVNFGAQFVPQLDYQSDPAIHPIFMLTVGVLIGAEAKRSASRRDRDDNTNAMGGGDE